MKNRRLINIINEELELFEGYGEVNEIMQLSEEVLGTYGLRRAEKIYEAIEDDLTLVQVFHKGDMFDNFSIIETDINKSYSILNDFIKNYYFSFYFGSLGKGIRGKYDENKKLISINVNFQAFHDRLKSLNILSADEYDENMIKDKIIKAGNELKIKSALVHEIQHAYDDYRSEGMYSTGKRSSKYDKRFGGDTGTTENNYSDERLRAYLNLPYEYWARFSQFISNIDIKSFENFNLLWNEFGKGFEGYGYLSPNDKKRIARSLYKYWDTYKSE